MAAGYNKSSRLRQLRRLLRTFPLLAASLPGAVDLQTVIGALRAHDFPRALSLTRELERSGANDPRVPFLEGMANEGLNNKAEALRLYRSALKIKPDFLPALKAEAQMEYADGVPAAGKTLGRIVELEPTDQVSHAMLAALAYKAGDCPSALTHYEKSAAVISTKADALTQYGECLLGARQADTAVGALTQALTLEPTQWWAHYNLAAAELSRKNHQRAIEILKPLVESEGVPAQVLDLAASAYEASGDTPQAVKLLRQAILAAPDNESYYLHFANVSFDHDSFQVGVDMINAGLTRLPRSARLFLARGILFGQLGDFAKAESDFDKADQFSGREAIAGAAASLAELQNSNLDRALQLSRAKLKTTPDDVMLHYVKAETLKQMGVAPGSPEFTEALQSAAAAVRLCSGVEFAFSPAFGWLNLKCERDLCRSKSPATVKYAYCSFGSVIQAFTLCIAWSVIAVPPHRSLTANLARPSDVQTPFSELPPLCSEAGCDQCSSCF